MKQQGDLFEWAASMQIEPVPTAQIIDALPALIRKAAMENLYQVPRPLAGGKVIPIERMAC